MKKLILVCSVALSIDANAQWDQETFYKNSYIASIHFPSPDFGYAVGVGDLSYGGLILKRTNNYWDTLTCKTIASLLSVYFTDSLNGFIVGGNCDSEILKTTDGGISWTKYAQHYYILNSVFFPTDKIGFAVGYHGTIIKTNNAGDTWEEQPSATINRLCSVHFPDENIGYVTGWDGTILKTIDGGSTWTTQTSGTSEDLFSVHFTDVEIGYALGTHGTILKTINGGHDWSNLSSGTTENLFAINFIDENTAYAVGNAILKTTDAGMSWNILRRPYYETFSSIYFTNAEIGYLGGRQVYKTNYGGNYIEEKIFSNAITIYPNPFSSSTTISFKEEQKNVTIRIVDLLGQEIKTTNFTGKNITIEKGGMSKGVYFVQVSDGVMNDVGKLVVE